VYVTIVFSTCNFNFKTRPHTVLTKATKKEPHNKEFGFDVRKRQL